MKNRIEEPQAGKILRWQVRGGFAAAIVLTALLGFLSWRNAQQADRDADWVNQAHEVSTHLEAALRHMLDVETGGRGFALDGRAGFLEPYESGRYAGAEDLRTLRVLIVDRDQIRRLTLLERQAREQLEDVDEIVSARRTTGNVPEAMLFERGKFLMDAARATVAEMEAQQAQVLQERIRHERTTRRFTNSAIALGSVLGMISLFIAGATVSREIAINARARAQVSALNKDLEQRVAQRSSALDESENRLAGVIQSATDSIITVDEEQRIVLFNAAAEKIFRCPAVEAMGQPITRFIPQRFHAAHSGHIKKYAETGVTSRAMGTNDVLWAVRADGQEFQIEASISQTATSEKKLFTVILRDVTERVQAAELRDRLAAIVDSSDDAIVSKDLKGTITAWNRGAEKVFGYSASETVGKSMLMLFPAERVSEESDVLERIERGDSVDHYETVRLRKDGKRIDVSVTISPIRDSRGTIIGASKIAHDISERKEAENKLAAQAMELAISRETLEEQARVLDLAPVMVRDMNGRVAVWPRGAEDLYGIPSHDAVGMVSHNLLHTEFPEPLENIEKKLFESGRWEGELVHRKGNGSSIFVASVWVLYRDEHGHPLQILEVNTDITGRKRAEERLAAQAQELSHQTKELNRSQQALEKQQLIFRSVLDSMSEGLVAADEKGKFILWNPAAVRIVGLGPSALNPEEWNAHYGVYLPDGVTPVPAEQNPLLRAIRGETCTAELFVHNPELPEGVWIELSANPLKDTEGKACGGVAAFRDITQRKMDEAEIHKLNDELEERVAMRTAELAAVNKELEAFTYSVSHDLRAPLRHMSGFTKILVEDFGPSLPEEAQKYLQRIESGAHHMGELVDELLNLARVGRQALILRSTRLEPIVRDILAMLEPESAGRQIEWKIAELPFVECDPTLIRLVFQNLIGNALKYSRPRSPAVIEIGQIQQHGNLTIFVRDNGVGFSMKYADKLFGVFQRLHRAEDFEGTGVGLATVQRIVQKHGGRIWAEAELDRGATFYFTLAAGERSPEKAVAAAGG